MNEIAIADSDSSVRIQDACPLVQSVATASGLGV